MSFTQSAFIRKNTPELIEKLLSLGYEKGNYSLNIPITSVCYGEINSFFDREPYPEGIDCGKNENLFLAIAAIRDDTDKNQYFVTEEEMHWVNQDAWMPVGSFILSYIDNYTDIDGKVHKATVAELIDHFGSDINVGSK